jgi:hypothetical protein
MRVFREGRLTRIFVALALAISASSLAAASDNPMESRAAGEQPSRASSPLNASSEPKLLSKFDYLVLASMADSMQPFTMAGYRDSGAADGRVAVKVSGHPNNKGNLQCHS